MRVDWKRGHIEAAFAELVILAQNPFEEHDLRRLQFDHGSVKKFNRRLVTPTVTGRFEPSVRTVPVLVL